MDVPLSPAVDTLAPRSQSRPAAASAATPLPWERPWWWCERGEVMTLVWVVFLHVTALVGLVLLPAPSWTAVIIAGVLLILGGLGTTVCYHRCLAHRAVKLNPLVEQALIFCALINGSGKPRTWVAMHRRHHATSDRPGDISSPHDGFWWSHLRWLWQVDQSGTERYIPDLTGRRYRVWGYLQIPLLAASAFGGMALGGGWMAALAAGLWIGPVRLLWALHTQCTVNSICHLGSMAEESGSSRNVLWPTLAHLGQGENWHGNHHKSPACARLGQRWWQIDVGWMVIRVLAAIGLARQVRLANHAA
jgi:fatty-acid desaturase